MKSDFNLNPAQKRAWAALLTQHASRGSKAKMAREIVNVEKKSDPATWKTIVTGFFKGEEKELRAVFEHPRRLRAAETGLGVDAGQFQTWITQITGRGTEDGPLDLRLSGFEDYGPVPLQDAYFAPPLGPSKIWLPPSNPGHGSAPSGSVGGVLKIDDLVAQAMPRTPSQAFAVVICASPGTGKSTTLRLLATKLEQAGAVVNSWRPGAQPTGGVLVCDDLDLLDSGQRSLLCMTVQTNACVLLTATSESDSLADLPRYRAVYTVAAGYEQWSLDYLNHLEQMLPRCGRTVSFAPLREWLQEDLFAPVLSNRLDNLGLLARHVADGGTLPPRYCDLPRWAVSRAASQIRILGHSAAALLIDQYGELALQEVAVEACRNGSFDVTVRTLIDAFRRAVSGMGSHQSEVKKEADTATIWIEAVDQLCHSGLFHGRGDRVSPTQPICIVSALGAAIARGGQVNQTLVEAVILSPVWTDALVSAAELINDGSGLLAALLNARPAILCQAIPAMTRLLATGTPFKDAATYRRAFLLCLSVWARWPADVRALTVEIGGAMDASPPAVNYERLVNGHAPLLVLARASLLHRQLLPKTITVEEIQQGRHVPEFLLEYMAIVGTSEITILQARDAIGLGAPFQSQVLLDPDFWRRLPPHTDGVGEMPAGFKIEDCTLWWRLAGAPRLLEMPDGEARVAGTHADHTIRAALSQFPIGCEIWKKALVSRIKKRDPRAAEVFAEAVLSTLTRGGLWNANTLRAVWDSVPTEREPLRLAVFEMLLSLSNWYWGNDLLLPWLIAVVVVAEEREALWRKWSESSPDRVPWKLFVDGGLTVVTAAQWAIVNQPKQSEDVSAWPPVLMGEGKHTNAQKAVKALIESGDVAVLELLIRSDNPDCKRAALTRLRGLTTAPARQLRLQLACEVNEELQVYLLQGLVPEPDEAALRHKLARQQRSPFWALGHWLTYSLVSAEPNPWTEVIECLDLIEAMLTDAEDGASRFTQWCSRLGLQPAEPIVSWQQLKAMAKQDTTGIVSSMGAITDFAEKRGAPDPRPLVQAVMSRPAVRRYAWGGDAAPLWLAALRYFGKVRIIALLIEDDDVLAEYGCTWNRLRGFALGQQVDFVRSLLTHPVLGRSAAQILAQTAYFGQPALLSAALQELPAFYVSAPLPSWHPVAEPLVFEYLRCAPDDSLEWFKNRLSHAPNVVRRALWGSLLPLLKPGLHRAQGLTEYLAVVAQ